MKHDNATENINNISKYKEMRDYAEKQVLNQRYSKLCVLEKELFKSIHELEYFMLNFITLKKQVLTNIHPDFSRIILNDIEKSAANEIISFVKMIEICKQM